MHLLFEAWCTRRHIQGIATQSLLLSMMQFAPASCAGNQSFRSEHHNYDQNDTKDQVADIAEGETRKNRGNGIVNRKEDIAWISSQAIELRQDKLVDSIHCERTNDHTGDTAYATNNYHGKVNHRITEAKVVWR